MTQTLKKGDVIVFTGNDHRFGELGVVVAEPGCCSIASAYFVEVRQDANDGSSWISKIIVIPGLTVFEIIDHDIDKNEVRKLVDSLVTMGFSEGELERTLDLPRKTLSTDNSEELIALLKIVNMYPWMIRVAEKNYDLLEAKKIMCNAAIDEMFSEKK